MSDNAKPRRRLTRADALALGVLLALACALMAPFLFQGRIPLNADFPLHRFEPWWRDFAGLRPQNAELDDPMMYIYPTRELSAAMLRRGVVPLWNPYILCGVPLLADDVSLPFDPFGLLTLALPFPTAWGTMILLQLVVTGWSMYALMRYYGCSRPAGVLSGATLMLCATFTVWLEYISWIGTFCWAPLCLLCIDVGVRRRRWLPFALAAVLLAFTIVGGLLQLALYFFAMVGLYGLWLIAAAWRRDRDWRPAAASLARLGAAFVLALLLAGVQFVPTVELAAKTYRAPVRYLGANSLSLTELVTYVAPNLFGHPARYDEFHPTVGLTGMLFRHGGYLGIVPLLLALVAVAQRGRERRVACHTLLSFGNLGFLFLLSLGLEGPLTRLVPAFGGLHAKRQVVVYAVSAAALAGFGLDALLAASRRRKLLIARAIGALALTALLAALFLGQYARMTATPPPWLAEWRKRSPADILALYRGALVPLLLLGGAWAVVRFGSRLGARGWAAALVALAAVDLLGQARLYNPFVPREQVSPPSPSLDWLAEQPGILRISGVSPPLDEPHPRLDWYDRRFKGDSAPPNLLMPYRLFDARGRSSLFPKRMRDYVEAVTGNDDIRVLMDYRAAEYADPRVSLLSPRYVLSPEPLDEPQFELVRDGPLRVYRNRAAVPRVFVVPEATVAASDAASLELLGSRDLDLLAKVVLAAPCGLAPSSVPFSRTAEIVAYGPNEVHIRLAGDGAGFVVLTDTWMPGWRAWVDGSPRPVLRANHLMRAVPVEPGEGTVHLAYEPRAFRLGLYLSLVGLAAVAASVGAAWARRQRFGAAG